MSLSPPRFTYENIRQRTQKFLDSYHSDRSVPIPIERIAEQNLRLSIAPFPHLRTTYRISGFLNASRTTIYIDADDYYFYPHVFRFTLAREVGHYALHQQLYSRIDFHDNHEFIDWKNSMPEPEISTYNAQSRDFAGLLLMPRTELRKECRVIIRSTPALFRRLNLPPTYIWSHIAHEVAKVFYVEPHHVEHRIERDRIPDKIRFK